MQGRKLLLLLLLLTVGCAGCGGKPPRSFHEPEGGFSYTPPAGWKPTTVQPWRYHLYCGPSVNGVVPRINVIREERSGTLAAYMDEGEAGYRRTGVFSAQAPRNPFHTEDGVAGFYWRFGATETTGGLPIRVTDYFLEHGDRKYVIACTAPGPGGEAYDAVFDACAKSFRMDD